MVYVASVSGHRAQPARMVYSVTKAAVHMLAKTGATQLAQHNIRVNSCRPAGRGVATSSVGMRPRERRQLRRRIPFDAADGRPR